MFVSFIGQHHPCIIVGHNFFRFDFPRIVRAFDLTLTVDTVEPLSQYVLGIADTLCLKGQYSAHNALGDVSSLQKLCTIVGFTDSQFSDHCQTFQSAVDRVKYNYDSLK